MKPLTTGIALYHFPHLQLSANTVSIKMFSSLFFCCSSPCLRKICEFVLWQVVFEVGTKLVLYKVYLSRVLPWTQGSCICNSKNSTVRIFILHLHWLKLDLHIIFLMAAIHSFMWEEMELLRMLSKNIDSSRLAWNSDPMVIGFI